MAITLKAARVNAGLTQATAVWKYNNETGGRLSQSTLLSWEKGRTWPTVQQFAALCKVYGVPMSDIFIPDTLTAG